MVGSQGCGPLRSALSLSRGAGPAPHADVPRSSPEHCCTPPPLQPRRPSRPRSGARAAAARGSGTLRCSPGARVPACAPPASLPAARRCLGPCPGLSAKVLVSLAALSGSALSFCPVGPQLLIRQHGTSGARPALAPTRQKHLHFYWQHSTPLKPTTLHGKKQKHHASKCKINRKCRDEEVDSKQKYESDTNH